MDSYRRDRSTAPDGMPGAGSVRVRGDGIVGCSAALALARLGYPVILESLGSAPMEGDVRTYALNAGSVELLRRLKVWDALPPDAACPVSDMMISGDAAGELQFSAWQQGVEALAWIVDAGELEAALRQAVRYAPHVQLIQGSLQTDHLQASLSPDRLLLLCEGRDSRAREALGVRFERQPYGQVALATRVTASRPHGGVASQWFSQPEVLALLPFHRPAHSASYGVVWSMTPERAQHWEQAEPEAFEAEIVCASGGACGNLSLAGPRKCWPLLLGRADRVHGNGWLLLGDSAHAVHPLAGQGLNLGLADVACLERVMAEREPWRGVGDERLLARHARERAGPIQAMAGVTDGLWHLFAHPNPLVRRLRNQGMTMLNHLSGLKRQLTRRALGLGLAAAAVMAAGSATDTAWAQAGGAAAMGAAPGGAAQAASGTSAGSSGTPAPPAIDAAIRKTLAERMPQLPKPDEISRSPVPGLWELRFGGDVVYVDERGDFLISGSIMETRTRRDLTAERVDKLNAIVFSSLPLKDAIVIKQGTGARKLVVFSDPNCGYCKRFERELLSLKDVTLYTFLYPVLGKDSLEKSRNIWCAADPAKAWREWMVDGRQPAAATARCDSTVLDRNTALGQRHRVDSTPTSVLEDGSRRNGSMALADIERLLSQIKPPKS